MQLAVLDPPMLGTQPSRVTHVLTTATPRRLISKLEQDRKLSARITTLTKIADAFDVDLGAIVGQSTHLESVPEDGGLLDLRRAITPSERPARRRT